MGQLTGLKATTVTTTADLYRSLTSETPAPQGTTTMLKVSITPDLTGPQKRELERWLTRLLAMDNFEGENLPRTLDKIVALYHSNRVYVLTRGMWQESFPYLYVGERSDEASYPVVKRLAVLLTLCQLIESPALTEAASTAISKFLLGQFNTLRSSLVVSAVPHTGIAFSETATAACLNGEWMTPSGEIVDITGEGWTVCMAPELVQVGEAVTGVAGRSFVVGDRVRYSSLRGLPGRAGEGVITILPTPTEDLYQITADGGRQLWWVEESAMTLITPAARPFAVGDRVLWTPHPDRDAPDWNPSEGTVTTWHATSYEGEMRLDAAQRGITSVYVVAADLSHI